MSKITLIGIDTAKNVFHLVGIDKLGNYTYRKQLSRQQLLPALAKLESCVVVLEACAVPFSFARCLTQDAQEQRVLVLTESFCLHGRQGDVVSCFKTCREPIHGGAGSTSLSRTVLKQETTPPRL